MGTRLRKLAVETFMWLAAGLGLLCIVFVALAYFMNISLMMFRTGSMEPTIPTGSVAVVQEVEAAEVEIGDVLTVDREAGQLPVTHRVTDVQPGDSPDERVITMQGDANDREDRAPYTITEAREVIFHVPGLAQPVNQLNNPWVLGAATLGASLLVGWTFWPRNPRRSPGSEEPTMPTPPRHAAPEADVTDTAAPFPEDDPNYPGDSPTGDDSTASQTKGIAKAVFGAVAVTGIAATSVIAQPAPASADSEAPVSDTEVIESQYLTLHSITVPGSMTNLAPGDTVLWDVGITADAPDEEPGIVEAGIRAAGDLPVDVEITACSTPWNDDPGDPTSSEASCSGSLTTVAEQYELPLDNQNQWLSEFSTDDQQWLRLEVSVPNDLSNDYQDTNSSIEIHAATEGDYVSTPPPDDEDPAEPSPTEQPDPDEKPSDEEREDLATTGFSSLWLALLAVGVLAAGLSVVSWVKRRREVTS